MPREVVARAAVFGELYPDKPGQLAILTPKKMQDDVHAKGNETPYSMRGTFYGRITFPSMGNTSSGGATATTAAAESRSGRDGRLPAASAAPAVPLPSADVVQPTQPGVDAGRPGAVAGRGPAPRRPLDGRGARALARTSFATRFRRC